MNQTFKGSATALAYFVLLAASGVAFAQAAPSQLRSAQGMEYASVSEINEKLASNELTSVELVHYLRNRIDALDKNGPAINAVIELNPEAIAIATALDAERREGQVRGPLHGIPILLKDNFDTADQMQTSAGSLAMIGQPPAHDAFVVQKLREAGAVVLGKTNMSEWANVRDMSLPNGWSGRGGQGKNPHVLGAEICGSSSGSAAGVAAGFAPLAVGSETNGSIACPASANGIVGFKPTLGLLSRSGMIPITRMQDTPGSMTRTVRDAALLLNVLQGKDPTDSATAEAPDAVDYSALLSADALSGKRIGYPTEYVGTNGTVLEQSPQFTQALDTLRSAGATLVPLQIRLPDIDGYVSVLMAGAKRELGEYLATREGLPIDSLQALIDFNELNPGPEGYGQLMLEAINDLEIDEATVAERWASLNGNFKDAIDEQLTDHNLDALFADADGYSQASAAIAGYPGITLPSGMNSTGVPTSVFFFGPRWGDAQLLALAYSYEQASMARQNPAFKTE